MDTTPIDRTFIGVRVNRLKAFMDTVRSAPMSKLEAEIGEELKATVILLERLHDLETALNCRDLFINPRTLDIIASEVDCCPCDQNHLSRCVLAERGKYCPNDLAETLRELAKVSRKIEASMAPQSQSSGGPTWARLSMDDPGPPTSLDKLQSK